MKCIVVIGTYNEVENIPNLLPEIVRLGDEYEAVVVDDNSPDGTGKIVEAMKAEEKRIHVVHRDRRLGYAAPISRASVPRSRWEPTTLCRWMQTTRTTLRTSHGYSGPPRKPTWLSGRAMSPEGPSRAGRFDDASSAVPQTCSRELCCVCPYTTLPAGSSASHAQPWSRSTS